MGLYKRGKTWWVTKDDKRFSTGETSRKKAEMVWAQFLARLQANGEARPPETKAKVLTAPPFELAAADYLEIRRRSGRGERSYATLMEGGCWIDTFGKRRSDRISSADIERTLNEWQDQRGWSNASRNNALAQLSGFFTYAVRKGWVQAHPVQGGRVEKLPLDNTRKRWLRVHEVEAILEAAPDWMKPVIRFAVLTGMRLGEICSLTRASYREDDRGHYIITERTKNGERLAWPLEGQLLELVEHAARAARFPGSHLFPGPDGKSPATALKRKLPGVVRAVGLEWGAYRTELVTTGNKTKRVLKLDQDGRKMINPRGVTFHTFRHTMASLALNAGVSEAVVQEMGNWKTRSMVSRYAHPSREARRVGAAAVAELFPTHNSSQSPRDDVNAGAVPPRKLLKRLEPTNGVEPLTC